MAYSSGSPRRGSKRRRSSEYDSQQQPGSESQTPTSPTVAEENSTTNDTFTATAERNSSLSPSSSSSPNASTIREAPARSAKNTEKSANATDNGKDLARQKHHRNPRAARACATCRKQKTRCFPAHTSRSCFRCLTLGLECSLLTDGDDLAVPKALIPRDPAAEMKDDIIDKRLEHIQHDVSRVLDILREGGHSGMPTTLVANSYRYRELERATPAVPESMTYKNTHLNLGLPDGIGGMGDLGLRGIQEGSTTGGSGRVTSLTGTKVPDFSSSSAHFGYCSHSYITSPFNAFGTLVSPSNVPPPIQRLLNPQMIYIKENVITMGLLTRDQTIRILDIFRKYYNQWVSFPTDISTERLLELMISRSSLLLTVCCSIIIRYHDPVLKSSIWRHLLGKLQRDLREAILIVPHTIEFIQALAILAIYASSLSEDDIVIDAWFVSSIALEHFITKDILGLVMSFDGVSPVTEMDEITAYRVWNHLCLVHVVNCNLSGRMIVLDGVRLNQSRRTLDLSASTNFDGRMVAEINLQVLTYNFIEVRQSLADIEEELRQWHNDWGYLFVSEQPETQFVETGYHFCYFLVLYHWSHRNMVSSMDAGQLTNDPADIERVFRFADTNILRRMIRHAIKVIEGVIAVEDQTHFMALSDQIHFFGSYTAVMLTRLVSTARDINPDIPLTSELVVKALRVVNRLAYKFQKLGDGTPNLATKYSNSIRETLIMCNLV